MALNSLKKGNKEFVAKFKLLQTKLSNVSENYIFLLDDNIEVNRDMRMKTLLIGSNKKRPIHKRIEHVLLKGRRK